MTLTANLVECNTCGGSIAVPPQKLHNGPTRPLDEVARGYANAQGWTFQGEEDFCPAHSA